MNDLISTYLNNGGFLSYFKFDEDALNKDVLTSLNSYLTNMFSGPSDNDMITYIRNSKGDNYFRDPTRLRLEEDDYKKLRKYLPIINNI